MQSSDYILLRFNHDHAGRRKHAVEYVLREFALDYIREGAASEVSSPRPAPKTSNPIAYTPTSETYLMKIHGGKYIRVNGPRYGKISKDLIAKMYGRTAGGGWAFATTAISLDK
jgi:hypothetical protein